MLTDFPWFKTISETLANVFQQDKFPHAILLGAPAKTAKKQFALTLAQALLCNNNQNNSLNTACGTCKSCQLFTAETHPDFYWIDRLVDTKGKQKQSIGIDQIRVLNQKLQDTPQLNGWRVAIISSVASMTTASFNALLKTLEEPGDKTLLLLLSDNIQGIPATIRSRCQLLVPDLSEKTVKNWLMEQSSESENLIDQALKDVYGAPLAALDYLQEDGQGDKNSLFNSLDQVLHNQQTPAGFLQNAPIEGIELADRLADYFFYVQTDYLCQKAQSPYAKLPKKLPYQLYAKLLDFKRAQQAGSNLQAKLQLEAILIQWFEIGRKISHYSTS